MLIVKVDPLQLPAAENNTAPMALPTQVLQTELREVQ